MFLLTRSFIHINTYQIKTCSHHSKSRIPKNPWPDRQTHVLLTYFTHSFSVNPTHSIYLMNLRFHKSVDSACTLFKNFHEIGENYMLILSNSLAKGNHKIFGQPSPLHKFKWAIYDSITAVRTKPFTKMQVSLNFNWHFEIKNKVCLGIISNTNPLYGYYWCVGRVESYLLNSNIFFRNKYLSCFYIYIYIISK